MAPKSKFDEHHLRLDPCSYMASQAPDSGIEGGALVSNNAVLDDELLEHLLIQA